MGVHLQGSLTLESVESGLRFRARFGERTHLLDSGEGAVAPDPVMALLEALTACGAMDVISILRKQRRAVTGYRIEMSGERSETHPRRFVAIALTHHVSGHDLDADAVRAAIELSETKYCSVRATLDPALRIVHEVVLHDAGA